MVVDKDFVVIYVNEGIRMLLCDNVDVFELAFKYFEVDNIVGSCIDIFYENLVYQCRILVDLVNFFYSVEICVGLLVFSLYILVFFDVKGNYNGSILEWVDIIKEKDVYVDFVGQIEVISKLQVVIEFQLDGIIFIVNDNFLKMMGYLKEDVEGKYYCIFVEFVYV